MTYRRWGMVLLLASCLAGSARADDETEPAEAAQPNGLLTVTCDPPGTVWIDGVDTGLTTPTERLELPGGAHLVQVYVPEWDHFTAEREVFIRAGVELRVQFRVITGESPVQAAAAESPGPPGHLWVSATEPATLYVDGVNTGLTTPIRNYALLPGRHNIRLHYPSADAYSESESVIIRARGSISLAFGPP